MSATRLGLFKDSGSDSSQHWVTDKPVEKENIKDAPWTKNGDGIYVNNKSGAPKYSSRDLFVSSCGWPNFIKPIEANCTQKRSDKGEETQAMGLNERTEVYDESGHLGHSIGAEYKIDLMPADKSTLKPSTLYIENNGNSLTSIKYSVIGPDKELKEGVISINEIPSMKGRITLPLKLKAMQPELEKMLKITTGREHTVGEVYCLNYSALRFVSVEDMMKESRYQKYLDLFKDNAEVQSANKSIALR